MSRTSQARKFENGTAMEIKSLKSMEVHELVGVAKELDVEGAAGVPYRELLYRIIKAHASRNGSVIAEGVLAMEMAVVSEDLRKSIHPHPTLSETIYDAAEMLFKG